MPERAIARPSLWHRFLVVCGLSAAALAAPLLDLYGRNPEVFVANRTSTTQIVLFGFLVAVGPPLVFLGLLTIGDRVGPRTGHGAYWTIAGLLSVAIGFAVSRQAIAVSTTGAIALGVSIAALLMWLFPRIEAALGVFWLAIPAVLVFFLGFSGTGRLIWDEPVVASTDTTSVGRTSSIVLLQLDEFPTASLVERDGTINEQIFPSFARLAEQGTWYRNAFSPSIATTQSVPAALTSQLGGEGLSPSAVDHPNNLFTLLGGEYEMHVIEWVADLCPEDICEDYAGRAPARFTSLLADVGVVYGHLLLPAAARENLPSIDNTWKGFVGQADQPSAAPVAVDGFPVPRAGVRSAWIDWMQRLTDGVVEDAPPTLSYAHLTSPHVPWRVNPSGTHYDRPEQYSEVEGVQGSGYWVQDLNFGRLAFQRHLYQLGFLDKMVGSLFEKLDATETWDDTMIIVVADHGVSFVPGEHRRWPYEDNRDDLYRVPLFIKYPGQTTGEIRDEPAYTIDILPTIVDTLEIDTDWEFDGASLLEIAGTDRPHSIIQWCCSKEGADTSISGLWEQVERNHEWIPVQDSWADIAAVGPYRDLVGGDVANLAPVESDEIRWTFENPEGLTSVDLGTGMLQTLVMGRLEFPAAMGNDFLIAVNGRVAGAGFVSRDTSTGGEIRGLVAEEFFTDGDNDVAILVPEPSGNGWTTGSADEITLNFVADDGHVLEVVDEGNKRIQIEAVTNTASGWKVVGWAADVSKKVTPDRIYIFAGDVLIANGPPNLDNKDVVRWHDSDDLLRSGFSFEIDADSIPESSDRLTVIAEFGGESISDAAILK